MYARITIILEPVHPYDCESDAEMDVLGDKIDVLEEALKGILPQLDKDFHYDVST